MSALLAWRETEGEDTGRHKALVYLVACDNRWKEVQR